MIKRNNTNKGITLIALVITIIVMLILVAVTITMAVNGGLFNYAGKAVGETKNAIDKEQDLASGGLNIAGTWYNSIDEYLNLDEEVTGTTLVSLWEAGELNVGDYVDYTPAGATSVNPDNPEGTGSVAPGTLTGYTTEAQSVAYESLKWRVLGYDETKNELLLISATPTTEGLNFYGHVGYNNYETVLKNVCSALYSNSSIGATARSITMNDIDTYLGGSTADKTKYYGGSDVEGGYGYRCTSVASRFNIDPSGNLVKLEDDEADVALDLTSRTYAYFVREEITDTTKLDLLQGSTPGNTHYYYYVGNRAALVYSDISCWCLGDFSFDTVRVDLGICESDGSLNEVSSCFRPVVSLKSKITTEQVPILSVPPRVTWNDPLGWVEQVPE